jgi:GTP-binding protein YchF
VKDVGIVGMPYSGKSTLFTALTGAAPAGGRTNQAVVDVPDERLEVLARLEAAEKVVPAKVRFLDVPGGPTAHAVAEFQTADALCLVVRAFGDDADPAAEHATLRSELVLADLAHIESGIQKAKKRARGSSEGRAEVEVLERAHELLESERLLHDAGLDDRDEKVLRGYGLLTMRPWLTVANVAEGEPAPEELPGAVAISAELEAEVADMNPSEAAELLAGYGIDAPAHDRVVAACYHALDLVTFLTTESAETHAWAVRRGATAAEAAGVIHSDMQRGFIRAEVVAYDDLVAAGSWADARSKGVVRVEGKDHVINEGDVIRVRFSV